MKIEATKNAIVASKKLYEALNLSEPCLEDIFRLVEEKKVQAEIFEKKTGLRWAI